MEKKNPQHKETTKNPFLSIICFRDLFCKLVRLKTDNWATTSLTKEKQGNKWNIQLRSNPQGNINS